MRLGTGAEMVQTPSKQNTGAVLVAFNPEPGLAERLRAIRGQISAMLVVDNSAEAAPQWLRDALSTLDIELASNGQNLGVGSALNQGLEWARERGLDWLATFDQDTFVYDSYMEAVGQAFENCPERDRVAMLGANYIESSRKEPWVSVGLGRQGWAEVVCLITSGSLVSMEAAESLGPFRDDFFVDLIDFEYCLRARANGLKVIVATTPLMEHAVGEPTWCRLLWKKNLTTPNHSPSRHYYFTRNHLVVIRRYFWRERGAILATINTRLKEIVLVICCERGKLGKLRGMALGALDAVRGRMGPADQGQFW